MKRREGYFLWRMAESGATPIYGVSYRIPGEEHILCTGMYKWQADWLVAKLNADDEYPLSPWRAEAPQEKPQPKPQ